MPESLTAHAETVQPSIDEKNIERRGGMQKKTGLITIGWDTIEKIMTEAQGNCPLYNRACIHCGAEHKKIRFD